MRVFVLLGWLALSGTARVNAQVPPIPSTINAFMGKFQQAISESSQPKAGLVSAGQYFLTDSSKVADTSYPAEIYDILHPEVPAKTWLNELSTTFGDVLFYSLDTTRIKINIIPGKNGPSMFLVGLFVTLEGLRKATQTRHQLAEEQVWQLSPQPKDDKLKLGYRIISIKSARKPAQTLTLTADRLEKLQKQVKEDLVTLAWEGSEPPLRKAILDRWTQQRYPDTLYVTQRGQLKKILVTEWGRQRVKGNALADLSIESLDLRWADAAGKIPVKEPIRRVTEWKNMRLSVNDSLFFRSRNVYYEKVDPTAKFAAEPTLTIVHIYVKR